MDLTVNEPMGEVRVHWPTCPICAAATRSSSVAFEALELVRCAHCAVVYKRFETPTLPSDSAADAGDSRRPASGSNRHFARRVAQAKNDIRAALEYGEARRLLDVGSGRGEVLEAGGQLGIASIGVDVSERAVKACRRRGYHAEVSSLESLPFQDAEFNLVVMRHVLEHTPSPKEALAEVRRVLSSKGLAVIASSDLTYRYFRPAQSGSQRYVYYSADNLRQLLDASGFEVLADTKATFRRRFARSHLTAAAREVGRFGWTCVGQAAAQMFALRRELFFVAQRSE